MLYLRRVIRSLRRFRVGDLQHSGRTSAIICSLEGRDRRSRRHCTRKDALQILVCGERRHSRSSDNGQRPGVSPVIRTGDKQNLAPCRKIHTGKTCMKKRESRFSVDLCSGFRGSTRDAHVTLYTYPSNLSTGVSLSDQDWLSFAGRDRCLGRLNEDVSGLFHTRHRLLGRLAHGWRRQPRRGKQNTCICPEGK